MAEHADGGGGGDGGAVARRSVRRRHPAVRTGSATKSLGAYDSYRRLAVLGQVPRRGDRAVPIHARRTLTPIGRLRGQFARKWDGEREPSRGASRRMIRSSIGRWGLPEGKGVPSLRLPLASGRGVASLETR